MMVTKLSLWLSSPSFVMAQFSPLLLWWLNSLAGSSGVAGRSGHSGTNFSLSNLSIVEELSSQELQLSPKLGSLVTCHHASWANHDWLYCWSDCGPALQPGAISHEVTWSDERQFSKNFGFSLSVVATCTHGCTEARQGCRVFLYHSPLSSFKVRPVLEPKPHVFGQAGSQQGLAVLLSGPHSARVYRHARQHTWLVLGGLRTGLGSSRLHTVLLTRANSSLFVLCLLTVSERLKCLSGKPTGRWNSPGDRHQETEYENWKGARPAPRFVATPWWDGKT